MSDFPDESMYEPDEQDTPSQSITPPKGTRRVNPPDELPTRTYNSRTESRPKQKTRPERQVAPPVMPPPLYTPEPNYPPPPEPRGRRKKRQPSESGMYLPWWSLVVMLAVVGGLAFGALLVVNTVGGQSAPGGATPIVIVITATYTIGPPASQTAIPQPSTLTPTAPLPTIASSATLPPGNFTIGATVQIVGVGGSGLNVRSGPGKQFTAKFLARDGEKYILKEGPQTASDEEWWHIQDPGNPNNDGWAARRFLTVVAQ